MNIFYLDSNPEICAQMHCDKHVVSQIKETTQMLCTTLHLSGNIENIPLKKTHENHPCNIWIRTSLSNYRWTCSLLEYLLKEYTYRYNKKHKYEEVLNFIYEHPPMNVPILEFTQPALAMPPEYRISDNPIECYHFYYVLDKFRFARWTKRKVPHWWKVKGDYQK